MARDRRTEIENNARVRRFLTDLVLDVFRLNGALLASGDTLVKDLGLTSARWQVLGAIALSPMMPRNASLKWQIICDAFILPHCRGVSGFTFERRAAISWRHSGWFRSFIVLSRLRISGDTLCKSHRENVCVCKQT